MFYIKSLLPKVETHNNETGPDLKEYDWIEVKVPIDEEGNTIRKPLNELKSIDINEAHDKLGHIGERLIRKTLKHLNIEVYGELKNCEGCRLAKAKQKNVSKTTNVKATKFGERLFIDTSGPFTETPGGSKYQFQVVDDFTRAGFIGFGKKKSDIGDWFNKKVLVPICGAGYEIKYMRADNAGENKKYVQELSDEFGITMEYTAPDTPQQNGVVEWQIAVLQQRANAMMIAANLKPTI